MPLWLRSVAEFRDAPHKRLPVPDGREESC
jgi:hypothetical protein